MNNLRTSADERPAAGSADCAPGGTSRRPFTPARLYAGLHWRPGKSLQPGAPMTGLDLLLIAIGAGVVTAIVVAACHFAPR